MAKEEELNQPPPMNPDGMDLPLAPEAKPKEALPDTTQKANADAALAGATGAVFPGDVPREIDASKKSGAVGLMDNGEHSPELLAKYSHVINAAGDAARPVLGMLDRQNRFQKQPGAYDENEANAVLVERGLRETNDLVASNQIGPVEARARINALARNADNRGLEFFDPSKTNTAEGRRLLAPSLLGLVDRDGRGDRYDRRDRRERSGVIEDALATGQSGASRNKWLDDQKDLNALTISGQTIKNNQNALETAESRKPIDAMKREDEIVQIEQNRIKNGNETPEQAKITAGRLREERRQSDEKLQLAIERGDDPAVKQLELEKYAFDQKVARLKLSKDDLGYKIANAELDLQSDPDNPDKFKAWFDVAQPFYQNQAAMKRLEAAYDPDTAVKLRSQAVDILVRQSQITEAMQRIGNKAREEALTRGEDGAKAYSTAIAPFAPLQKRLDSFVSDSVKSLDVLKNSNGIPADEFAAINGLHRKLSGAPTELSGYVPGALRTTASADPESAFGADPDDISQNKIMASVFSGDAGSGRYPSKDVFVKSYVAEVQSAIDALAKTNLEVTGDGKTLPNQELAGRVAKNKAMIEKLTTQITPDSTGRYPNVEKHYVEGDSRAEKEELAKSSREGRLVVTNGKILPAHNKELGISLPHEDADIKALANSLGEVSAKIIFNSKPEMEMSGVLLDPGMPANTRASMMTSEKVVNDKVSSFVKTALKDEGFSSEGNKERVVLASVREIDRLEKENAENREKLKVPTAKNTSSIKRQIDLNEKVIKALKPHAGEKYETDFTDLPQNYKSDYLARNDRATVMAGRRNLTASEKRDAIIRGASAVLESDVPSAERGRLNQRRKEAKELLDI